MARYVSTKSAAGGSSSGGGSGLTVTEVCNTICKLATQTPASQPSPLIMPGFGCWEMICNCPCWTDCYGCCVIWNVDTSKYRAFKVHYTGIRNCACCYTYVQPGFGNDECFCCCNYAYRGRCVCRWPMKSCCCWEAYQCCWPAQNACVYCCNSQWDNIWSFEFTICAPMWHGCTSGNQGTGVFYDWWYFKNPRCCDDYDYSGCDRQKGHTFCACLFWSCKQNATQYVTRMCLKTCETPFQSALAGGNYPSNEGGDKAAGTPCWTIWGIPCDRPEFGTCSMTTS